MAFYLDVPADQILRILAEERIHREYSTQEEAWRLYDGLVEFHSIKSMITLKETHRIVDNTLSIPPLTLLPPSEMSVCNCYLSLLKSFSSSFLRRTVMLPASEGKKPPSLNVRTIQ